MRYIRCIQTTVSNKLTIVPAWNIKVAGGCGFLETRDNNGGCTALLLTFKHLPRCPSLVSQPASESSRQLCRAVNESSRSFTVPNGMLNGRINTVRIRQGFKNLCLKVLAGASRRFQQGSRGPLRGRCETSRRLVDSSSSVVSVDSVELDPFP